MENEVKKFIALKDGQKLAYQRYGTGKQTLFLFHGLAGSSWLGDEWISAIESSDVSCIVFERPGYGDSSSLTFDSVNDWIPVFDQAAQALEIESADVVGCSAGAPYAYATAYGFPTIIKKVWILGGVPTVYMEKVLAHYSAEAQNIYKSFISRPIADVQNYYEKEIEDFFRSLPENAETYLKNTMRDLQKSRCFGMAQESRLQIIPWGFDVATIKQPVVLFHGQNDKMIPYDAAVEMTKILKISEIHMVDNELFAENDDVHRKSISLSFLDILRMY